MSGIAAILNLDGSAVPPAEVERMANVLKPYGPDRQKTLTRGNAAFVFCLHHLTPEDLFERQPLLFANRFVMLFDGRIDNRSELGEALGIAASELHSMPDSMIALRLFDRWGERAFERIVGVFAIIIMDLQDGRLICARDHMGLRVLHYHRSAERFAVATTPEALFALSWVPRILNKDKVADALVHRGLNGETTYYQEIFRVLPGSIVRVRGASFSKDRFWDPENIADVRFKSDQEYVEAFQERLDDAVKARLRSRQDALCNHYGWSRFVQYRCDRGRHACRKRQEIEHVHSCARSRVHQGRDTRTLLRRNAIRPSNSGSQSQHRSPFCSAE